MPLFSSILCLFSLGMDCGINPKTRRCRKQSHTFSLQVGPIAFTSLGTTSSNGAAFTRHGRNYMRNQRLNNNVTKLKIKSRTSPSINEKTPVQCSPPRSR